MIRPSTEPRIVNLTPHEITVYCQDGVKQYPPSGALCRVRASSEPDGVVDGVSIYRSTYGALEGLPDPLPGVYYLTSSLILKALDDAGVIRPDVLAPGTGQQDGPVRGEGGRIVGVTRLIRQGSAGGGLGRSCVGFDAAEESSCA